jgi:hypothetical protein
MDIVIVETMETVEIYVKLKSMEIYGATTQNVKSMKIYGNLWNLWYHRIGSTLQNWWKSMAPRVIQAIYGNLWQSI